MSAAKTSVATATAHGKAAGKKKHADPCSRTAADQAVDLLLNLHNREQSGKVVDLEFVAMAKGIELRGDAIPKPPPSPIAQLVLENPMILHGIKYAAGAAVLYGLFLLLSPLWTTYHVAGKVYMNRMEADGVELVFYSASGAKITQGVSASGGAFRVGGLGRGEFKVTAKRLEGGPKFPDSYASPQSTPWRVKLDKSLDTVTLYATDAPQKAEPPPKFDD